MGQLLFWTIIFTYYSYFDLYSKQRLDEATQQRMAEVTAQQIDLKKFEKEYVDTGDGESEATGWLVYQTDSSYTVINYINNYMDVLEDFSGYFECSGITDRIYQRKSRVIYTDSGAVYIRDVETNGDFAFIIEDYTTGITIFSDNMVISINIRTKSKASLCDMYNQTLDEILIGQQ